MIKLKNCHMYFFFPLFAHKKGNIGRIMEVFENENGPCATFVCFFF